jgi:hypothetical protein
MEKYRFSVPVRVNYIADESTISIETIDDLEEVQEKYSVDLSFIVDEFEYRVDSEKESMEDDEENGEYFGMSEEDIFNDVISDNWDDIVKRINREYRLEDLSDEEVEKLFLVTKESFEKCVSVDDSDETEQNHKILSASLTEFNKPKNEFYVEVGVNRKLKKEEIEQVRNWVEYHTSESWGVKFSKTDLSDKLQTEDIYVYLIPWSLKKDVKYVKE